MTSNFTALTQEQIRQRYLLQENRIGELHHDFSEFMRKRRSMSSTGDEWPKASYLATDQVRDMQRWATELLTEWNYEKENQEHG